ncbi:LysR substrate-binding domain-containing protein [Falsiroseomonas bella]|nr:LysR substrate-binding domain-containing protein [Falsiroseomonas bella]
MLRRIFAGEAHDRVSTVAPAAREGIGLAVLPCYHGDPEPRLVRVLAEPVPALTRELWVVTHEDLRRTARVRACLDVIGEGIAAQRALIEGAGSAGGTA